MHGCMYVCMYKGTKVRPTVGGPKCPTRKLSELIITLLKPLLKHVKSYTRDSIYFLTYVAEISIERQLLQLLMKSAYT